MGMDKDVRTIVNYKLSAEITKLRSETNASVEALALLSKEARAEMKKEMLYAIRSASQVAKADLNQAVLIANKKFVAFEKKASASHAKSALERKAIKAQAVAAGKSISRMLTDAVATVNRAQLAYADEPAKAEKASAAKFGAAYVKLATDRRYASQKLGAAVAGLNDSLAKQAALADSRFAKTVKDLG